jgi:hypothetical protein
MSHTKALVPLLKSRPRMPLGIGPPPGCSVSRPFGTQAPVFPIPAGRFVAASFRWKRHGGAPAFVHAPIDGFGLALSECAPSWCLF